MTKEPNRFRFRAWNEHEKKMYSPANLGFGDDGSALTITTELKEEATMNGKPTDWRMDVVGESCVLMQSTGTIDKNGKEVFEGDIVKYDDGDNWETGRDVVKFKNGAFNTACFHPDWHEFISESRIIEVIGNAYENPELLK